MESSLSSARSKGRRIATLAFGVLALVVAGCGDSNDSGSKTGSSTGSSTTASSDPFKILTVLPTSGPFAVGGNLEINALQAAINVINKDGGILGHKLTMKVVDDKADPTKAVSALKGALAEDDYNLISAGIYGGDALPMADLLVSNPALQMTVVDHTGMGDSSKYPNVFLGAQPVPAVEAALVDEMKSKGVKSTAVIYSNDENGKAGADAVADAADKAGIKVTAKVGVDPTATNATPQLQQATAGHPDALVMPNTNQANGPMLKARHAVAPDVPLYVDFYTASIGLTTVASEDELKGVVVQAVPYAVKGDPAAKQYTSTPEWKAFYDEFSKLSPEVAFPIQSFAWVYNQLMQARAAAVAANSVDGPAMVKALRTLTGDKVDGYVGPRPDQLYSEGSNFINYPASSYIYVNPGPVKNGFAEPFPG